MAMDSLRDWLSSISSSSADPAADTETSQADSSGAEETPSYNLPYAGYSDSSIIVLSPDTVSSGDFPAGGPYTSGTGEAAAGYYEIILQDMDVLLESQARIQEQNEACISILLIFLVVGLLNYVYKFFKMFF